MVFIISSQITNRNRKVPGYSPGKPNLLQVHFGSGRTRRRDLHYLLHCTCHANHREIFTTYFTSECQNFQNLDDKCKLIWVLNNEDSTILRYLCQYLLSTTIWLNGIGDLQTGWPALSTRKKIFLLASSLDARCWLYISLFLPEAECACTTIIDISPRIFSLMYCCCVSIIIVICICPLVALI